MKSENSIIKRYNELVDELHNLGEGEDHALRDEQLIGGLSQLKWVLSLEDSKK